MNFEDFLSENLKHLSLQHQALFASLLCERLYLNYSFFSIKENWGDIEVLDESLITLYQFIKNGEANKKEIKKLIKNVDKVSPDLDRFSDSASYALDSCSAFDEALNFLLNKDIDHIVNISIASTDSVDMFIQELENFSTDKDLEYTIKNHRCMIIEHNYQKAIIERLKQINVISNKDIEELRLLNKTYQSINLNLIYF